MVGAEIETVWFQGPDILESGVLLPSFTAPEIMEIRALEGL